MFLTGALYLVFEETIARRSGASGVSNTGSRVVMGIQVCRNRKVVFIFAGLEIGQNC